MRLATVLTLSFSLFTSAVFAGECTPSFDYCADELIKDKGWTEASIKEALAGSEFADADINTLLYHCTNPGAIGHFKKCASGCQDSKTEGSKKC
ncbi:hypothetical protein BDV18DRAFT_134940 [Aspergillus unguis]